MACHTAYSVCNESAPRVPDFFKWWGFLHMVLGGAFRRLIALGWFLRFSL